MGGRGLLQRITVSSDHAECERKALEELARIPGADQYSDEEVCEFLALVETLDRLTLVDTVLSLQHVHIAVPPDLVYDRYRLGRYVLSQWRQRRSELVRIIFWPVRDKLVRSYRKEGVQALVWVVMDLNPPVALLVMARAGLEHYATEVQTVFPPWVTAWHQALMAHGRLMLHRCVTEPLPPRPVTRWAQAKLVRLLRVRTVQVRSLKASLRSMRQGQALHLRRWRNERRVDDPKLQSLAAKLADLRGELEACEQRFGQEREELRARHTAELARIRAELESQRQDYAAAAALRQAWVPVGR